MAKPNFAQIVSDRFNVGSGDHIQAYEVSKLLSEQYEDWCAGILSLIKTMQEKNFYEEIIVEEIEKRLISDKT